MDPAQLAVGRPPGNRVGKSSGASGAARSMVVCRAHIIVITRQPVVGVPVVVNAQGSLVPVEQVRVDTASSLRFEEGYARQLKWHRGDTGRAIALDEPVLLSHRGAAWN